MTVRAETQIDLARVDDGSPGTPGQNGATFTPAVDGDGDISWTNDGGLPNPPTQNIMGPQGNPGTPGTNGVSVTSVEPQYYLSTSDTSTVGGSWSSTPATFVSGEYYWTRDYITYSDGSHSTSTEVYNTGMTQAAQDAYDAKTLADDTNQYFWYAPTGADTGAHITEVPQDEWSDSSDPNYHSGGNLLARSTGIAVRDGLVELASFGSNGVMIGENANGKSRSEISTSGMQIYQNVNGTDTQIANIGYGPGNDDQGGTSNAPYYTIGKRLTGSAIGNYSVAAGRNVTASGDASFAAGSNTIASNNRAAAFGSSTTASDQDCFAAGTSSVASMIGSFVFGGHSESKGGGSFATGYHVIAQGGDQVVLGRYNTPKGSPNTTGGSLPVVLIGNGTSDNARSNALEINWEGNVLMALDTTAVPGTTDYNLYAAITALGWESDVIV